MTLSSLFGLGWGIGLLATQDIYSNKAAHNTVAALFILATTFHGVLVFIMHCLRSEKIKKVWKKWFFGVTGRKLVMRHESNTTNKLKSDDSKVANEYELAVVPKSFGTSFTMSISDEKEVK